MPLVWPGCPWLYLEHSMDIVVYWDRKTRWWFWHFVAILFLLGRNEKPTNKQSILHKSSEKFESWSLKLWLKPNVVFILIAVNYVFTRDGEDEEKGGWEWLYKLLSEVLFNRAVIKTSPITQDDEGPNSISHCLLVSRRLFLAPRWTVRGWAIAHSGSHNSVNGTLDRCGIAKVLR